MFVIVNFVTPLRLAVKNYSPVNTQMVQRITFKKDKNGEIVEELCRTTCMEDCTSLNEEVRVEMIQLAFWSAYLLGIMKTPGLFQFHYLIEK